ncbi:MAG: AAA family ATPase, partial [Lachnospiraceae bacterium]|nr:AAA family ATPase [Lachnospiraceae bacterium]
LARGLVHNPDILFLDEPASGLDPKARYELKEILKNLSSMGKTIIISSHILPELAEMCTSVGIIDKGHLVLQGTMEEIHRAAAMSSPLNLTVDENQIDDVFAILQNNPYVQKVTAQGSILKIVFTGTKEEEGKMLATLVSSNIAVNSFYREEGSLESLFMQIVSGQSAAPKKRSLYE